MLYVYVLRVNFSFKYNIFLVTGSCESLFFGDPTELDLFSLDLLIFSLFF